MTEDIDITLAAEPDRLNEVLRVCASADLAPLPAEVGPFVAETFVLPARHALSGFRVDFVFSSTTYERGAIGRAQHIEIGGEAVPFATAEDLLIHKLFAARWAAEFAAVPGREGMSGLVAELRGAIS